jgi:hypothetical protein
MIMTAGARGYVVRNADPSNPGVEEVFPYTLRGLRRALEAAEVGSFVGTPKVVVKILDGVSSIMCRFEEGHRTS